MGTHRLFIVDCEGVLYPKENISRQEFLDAINQVFMSYGITKKILTRCLQLTAQKKYQGIYNYVYTVAQECGLSYKEITRRIAEATNYNKIQPNPEIAAALIRLREKNNICIYTDSTNYHVEAVFKKLFNGQTPEQLDIPVFHIGTLQRQDVLYPKCSKESTWLLEKVFTTPFQNMYLLDDSPANIRTFPGNGVLITPEQNLIRVATQFAEDKISEQSCQIQRYERTPFDRPKELSLPVFQNLFGCYRS